MSNSVSPTSDPTIVIDLKRNLIRIHRKTLHLLNDPEYVQLLVNPAKRIIALRPTIKEDSHAQKIRWTVLRSGNKCFEIRSKYLVIALQQVCYELKYAHIYRISGKYYKSDDTAVFNINEAVSVNSSDEEE